MLVLLWVRLSHLQHVLQNPPGVLRTGAVGLVDDQDVSDLQNPRLDRLDVIAQARCIDYYGGVG